MSIQRKCPPNFELSKMFFCLNPFLKSDDFEHFWAKCELCPPNGTPEGM